MNTTPLLEVQSLNKSYQRTGRQIVRVVDDVSFAVRRGEIVGLLGPNGAGKTTTMKMLCGLVQPDAGSVTIAGTPLQAHRSANMRTLGVVLEGTRNVYWTLSVWQNLGYFARLKGVGTRHMQARGEHLLRELALWERRHERVGRFSRGMQQQVAIACALIHDPHIILLDEPTLGLDVAAARTVRQWITRLARAEQKAILVTSHELGMVQATCDRVVMMRRGRLLVDQPMTTLLASFREADSAIVLEAGIAEALVPEGWTATRREGQTVLTAPLHSYDALQRTLAHLHQRGIGWHTVQRVQPTLEEVFVRLTQHIDDEGGA